MKCVKGRLSHINIKLTLTHFYFLKINGDHFQWEHFHLLSVVGNERPVHLLLFLQNRLLPFNGSYNMNECRQIQTKTGIKYEETPVESPTRIEIYL